MSSDKNVAFISWSGSQSNEIAEALGKFLTKIFSNSLDVWISSGNLSAGKNWYGEVYAKVREARIGILCITKENKEKPWILFEAGALMKDLNANLIIPYLIGITTNDLLTSPLHQFQSVYADEKGTFKLVTDINKALGKHTDEDLKTLFEARWPKMLQPKLADIQGPPTVRKKVRELLTTMHYGIAENLITASQLTKEMQNLEAMNPEQPLMSIESQPGPILKISPPSGPSAFLPNQTKIGQTQTPPPPSP